jgi:hypothetical protein
MDKDLDSQSAAQVLLGIVIDMLFIESRKKDSSTALGLDEAQWKKLAQHYGYSDYEDFQVDLCDEGNRYMEEF